MKNHLILFVLLIAVFSIPSCGFDDDGLFRKCEKGSGPEVEVVLNVPAFTGVRVQGSTKVFIKQDSFFDVRAKGQKNIIDLLELDVQNNTWDIEFDRCVKDHDVEIFITMPDISFLGISGSGEIRGDNFFEVENIILRISGSGELCLGLIADKIDGNISGSGKMELEGEAGFLDFRISGSGDLKAFDLITDKADINISGSGDASVHVLDVLDVRISGSGHVYYKGNPVLNLNISGSGDVVDAN